MGVKPAAPGVTPHPGDAALQLPPEAEAALSGLYQSIVGALPEQACRVVQFVASKLEDGSSTIVRQLALTLACQLGRPVLLVDALRQAPMQLEYFKIAPVRPGGVADEIGAGLLATPFEGVPLHLSRIPLGVDSIATAANADALNAWMKSMRAHYEFILIDLPEVGGRLARLQVASQVDGVVLTARAGGTRWQTIHRWMETLNAQGARVLGVMLNKVKPPIPQCIYERL